MTPLLTVRPVSDGVWSVMERSPSRVAIAYFPRKWAALKHAVRLARTRSQCRVEVRTAESTLAESRDYEQPADIEGSEQ